MQNQPSDAELQAVSTRFLQELTALEQSNKWEKSEDKPVLLYTLEREERQVSRVEIILNLPFQTALNFFSDPHSFKRVSEMVNSIEVLYQTPAWRVLHIKMQGGGPISPSELVVVNTIQSDGQKAYIGNRSCNFPVKEDPDLVRAEVHVTANILEKIGEKQTKLTSIADIDIKGMVPNFVKGTIGSKRAASLANIEDKIRASLK